VLGVVSIAGVGYALNKIFNDVITPIGMKVGSGIEYVCDIPSKIKNSHVNHVYEKQTENNKKIKEEILERQRIRKL